MWSLLLGIVLGLGAAVPIGPVNVEIARRTINDGFLRGLSLGMGAVTVDVVFAFVTGLSLQHVFDLQSVRLPLLIGGTCLMLCLSVGCFRSAPQAKSKADEQLSSPNSGAKIMPGSLRAAYFTGLLMTSLNPMTLAFWVVVVPAAKAGGQVDYLPIFCVGVFLGTSLWVISLASTISWLRKFTPGKSAFYANMVGGAILMIFAILGFGAIVQTLMS